MLRKSFEKISSNPYLYFFTIIIEFIILYLIIYKWNPFDVKNRYPFTIIIPIFFLSLGFIQLMNIFFIIERKKITDTLNLKIAPNFYNFLVKIITTIFIFIGIIFIIWGSLYLITSFPILTNILLWIINTLIIISISVLIYSLIRKYITGKTYANPVLNGLQKILLFLPGLLTSNIEYIKNELKLTTNTTWIILIISILFIILRIFLPKLISKLTRDSDGTLLLDKPQYLNHKDIVGKHILFFPDDKISYRYSISAWFWINPQPPNTNTKYNKYLNILNFGDLPSITYNPSKHMLKVVCKKERKNDKLRNSDNKYTNVYQNNNIYLQRWNHIVINYMEGNMDVFLNGILVGSSPNISPYITYEPFIIGEENGLEGAITKVVYKNDIMGKRDIENQYSILNKIPMPFI